jgi:UDP-glucuronate 4-epimerase
MKASKVLVTGISGMIGRELARYLLREGCEVHGVARFSRPGSREEITSWGVTTWKRDLVADSLDDMPDDFEYVFHEAAHWIKGGAEPITDPLALSTNALAAGRVMAHWQKVKAVMLASTGGIYPEQDEPSNEDTPVAPNSDTYHLGKFAMEEVGTFCSLHYGIPTVIMRYFWPVFFEEVITRCIDAARAGAPMPGADGGEPHTWTPIDVEDLCYYTARSVEVAETPPKMLVCGGPEIVKRAELSRIAAEALGVEAVTDPPPEGQQLQLSDSSRLFELFGEPKKRLSVMVRESAAAR